MEVRKILEKMGYANLLSGSWYGHIQDWLSWYEGKTAFHKYTIYNGQENVFCIRKSLGMAKKVCEDKADLLLNEKVNIYVSPVKESLDSVNLMQKLVDDVLEDNNFWVNGNQLIELTNSLGSGAFVEYKNNDRICMDFIPASCIWPLCWRNRNITECAFASVLKIGKGKPVTYIQRHIIEGGQYVIYNDMFGEDGKKVALPEGLVDVWATGSMIPLFQIVTPNIVNNIDILNPMGVSIYANASDILETVDLIFDSYHNEFKLGKKRIFVDDTVVKANIKDGTLMPIFDPNDTLFYGLPGADNSKSITESNMDLRVEAHKMALQDALDILSDKCGFGKGYYKFDTDDVQTATAVISQNSKLFRKICKDEIILEKALTDMTKAILHLGGITAEASISVSFDDSIVEDTNGTANRAMLEFQSGIIDEVSYLVKVYDMTEEEATESIKNKIKREMKFSVVEPDPLLPSEEMTEEE